MTRIRKVVFPVGGLGTRFLPATKAAPKEMLPVVDKPLIQYAVEEAYAAGVRDMIFVTGRSKRAIEDHFDTAYELENELEAAHKDELLALVEATRDGRWFKVGLSPRGAQTWLKLARARALLQGRTYVVPDDLRDLAGPVLRHRLQPVGQSSAGAQIQAMLAAVPWA